MSRNGESEQDNIVQVPMTVIVLDENDNPPEFQKVSRAKVYFFCDLALKRKVLE